VAKAADCKSAIVGSTPTGASLSSFSDFGLIQGSSETFACLGFTVLLSQVVGDGIDTKTGE
jgi:hypothetical protein